jgi:tetratricopeptide (TPR) repeat protein
MNDNNCHSYREALDQLIDGSVEESSLAALKAHADVCPACKGEYEWILQISADLEFIGDELVSNLPEIDIVASVMSKLPAASHKPDTVVSITNPPAHVSTRQTHASMWSWTAVAAAAVVLIVAGWLAFGPGFSSDGDLPNEDIAQRSTPDSSDDDFVEVAPPVDVAINTPDATVEIPLRQTRPLSLRIFPEARPEESPESGRGSLTRNDVTQAYVASLTSDNLSGMERLLALAEINREQASEILANAEASPEARVAAAQIVDGPEGAQALFEAVGRNPESPYLRARLAQSYSGDPATEAQALEQITELRDQAPKNAYWAYLDAERLFAMGETEAALESLRVASGMERLTTYPLEGAQDREQYMIESGIDPEVAHLLSSLTAGILEMDDISNLASNLIGYGEEAQIGGDEETAAAIYQSVANLGMQVDNGAVLAQERNTAAAVTEAAAASLERIGEFLDNPETIEQLLGVTSNIVSEVTTYFENVTETLLSDTVSGFQDSLWGHIADTILTGGDLNLLDVIGDFIQP